MPNPSTGLIFPEGLEPVTPNILISRLKKTALDLHILDNFASLKE
jgi:hypothetical protein